MAFGGEIVSAKNLMHGKTSDVTSDGKTIYQKIRSPFRAMRYHSLAVNRDTLPDLFEISSESDDGEIMGIRHREHPTEGVQFHPESIMTTVGKRLLRNFLSQTITQPEQKGEEKDLLPRDHESDQNIKKGLRPNKEKFYVQRRFGRNHRG